MVLENYEVGFAKKKLRIAIFFLLFLMIFIFAPFIGSHHINIKQAIINIDSSDATIFFTIRLPRVILAAIAGGGLAVCGMVSQGNPHRCDHRPYRGAFFYLPVKKGKIS